MALAVHEVFIVFCSDWLADGKYDVILRNANEPNPNGVLVGVITLENMSESRGASRPGCRPPKEWARQGGVFRCPDRKPATLEVGALVMFAASRRKR
jgi:hypothetical protein